MEDPFDKETREHERKLIKNNSPVKRFLLPRLSEIPPKSGLRKAARPIPRKNAIPGLHWPGPSLERWGIRMKFRTEKMIPSEMFPDRIGKMVYQGSKIILEELLYPKGVSCQVQVIYNHHLFDHVLGDVVASGKKGA